MTSLSSSDITADNKQSSFMKWVENDTHQALLVLVTFLGFIYRLLAALSAQGIIHPDEVYQSLEISHLIVFDTGRKAAEFQTSNPNFEHYAASRSWTFPWIFAIFMYIGEFFGMDYHNGTLVMIRIFMAINATLLIPIIFKLMYQLTKNKNIALYAAILNAFWFRIVEFTVRTLNNTFFLPILFYGIYRVLLALERKEFSKFDHLIWAIGLGISTYNRLDLFIFILGFFVMTFNLKSLKTYTEVFLDSLYGWLFCFLVDYHYYHKLSPVPLNWFKFNFIDGGSDIFGLNSWDYYINELIIRDGLIQWSRVTILLMLITFLIRFGYLKVELEEKHKSLIKIFHNFSAFTIITWLVYASVWRDMSISKVVTFITFGGGWDPQSHKEIRFIIGGLILVLCLYAIAVELLIELFLELISKVYNVRFKNPMKRADQNEIKYWIKVILSGFLIAMLVFQSVQSSPQRYHLEAYDDINLAMEWVGRQDDLESVMIAIVWFLTGGYTYLHVTDPSIEIVNVDFAVDQQSTKNYYINTFRSYVEDASFGKYYILPYYQIGYFPEMMDILILNGWVPVKVIDSRAQVWKSS